MTRLVFDWPNEAGESVRAARGRLEVAGERLARRPFNARLATVARVIERWSAPDSPWRRELIERLANETPFHEATIKEGLDAALRSWDPQTFVACARREIDDASESGRLELAPYSCTSVLAGGSIPMPTILSGLLPLALGSPVLLRGTSKDSVTGGLLARSIAHCDDELGDCLEVARIEVEDRPAMDAFFESPCIVATGSDETIASIRNRLSPEQRFVAYGHRFSIAVLGPETNRTSDLLDAVARGLALDIARWDQSGCLSPVDVYLVGLSDEASLAIAQRVAEELASLSDSMPRGTYAPEILAAHSVERREARMRAAVADSGAFFEEMDFALSLEVDSRPRPAPLLRFTHLVPIESTEALERVLSPVSMHLSNAAVAGFDENESKRMRGLMNRLGVSRICAPGRLQTPPIDWPHDGMPLFTPMARFVE